MLWNIPSIFSFRGKKDYVRLKQNLWHDLNTPSLIIVKTIFESEKPSEIGD
jgi:hypothetical protein